MAGNVQIVIEAIGKGFNSTRREMEGLTKGVTDLRTQVKGLVALELAREIADAAAAAREFTMAGVEATRIAGAFRGNMEGLRRATGNAIDDTSLQRMDTLARRTGLASSEIESLSRLATKFARESGEEMAATFQQLMDASPEQMEKWGILTSELTEELKGLDTVGQKAVLRQALIAEGAKVTNEEIAEQTHAVELLSTQWDNAVSSAQEWVAAALQSDGVRDAMNYVAESMGGLNDLLSASAEAWYALDPGIGAVARSLGELDGELDVFTATAKSALGPLFQLGNSIHEIKSALSTNGTNAVLESVEEFNAQQQAEGWRQLRTEIATAVADMKAAEAEAARIRKENFDDLDTGELMLDGRDPRKKRPRITLGADKPKRSRSAVADAFDPAAAAAAAPAAAEAFWAAWMRETAEQQLEQDILAAMGADLLGTLGETLSTQAGAVTDVLGDGWQEYGMLTAMLLGTGKPDATIERIDRVAESIGYLSSEWAALTHGMGGAAAVMDDVLIGFHGFSAAMPEMYEASKRITSGTENMTSAVGSLAASGIGAMSAFTGALVDDQHVQAGILAAMETARAFASWPDPVGIAQHTAAAALFTAVAAGAFDSAGGSARAGASPASATPFGGTPLADGRSANTDRETRELMILQMQVDGRVFGEVALGGANAHGATYRRGQQLDASLVGGTGRGLW